MITKKGQTEILGFAIVIILLILALVFFVVINSEDSDDETRLIRSNLRANSALNALMKLNVGESQVKDLIEECYLNNENSCNVAILALESNLEQLFEGNYYFVVSDGDKILKYTEGSDGFEFGEDCGNSISASPFIFRGFGKAELKICT